jgi:hypothetical protein
MAMATSETISHFAMADIVSDIAAPSASWRDAAARTLLEGASRLRRR